MRNIFFMSAALALLTLPAVADEVDLSELGVPEIATEIVLEPGAEAGPSVGQHRFILTFEPASNSTSGLIRDKFMSEGVFADVLDELSDHIALPQDFPIIFGDCGRVNAFYSPSERAVHICYELIEMYNTSYQQLQGDAKDLLGWADQSSVLTGTTLFVLLHEIGHAMTDMFDLPITGREEDAVDQFAATILIDADEEGDAFEERPSRLALLGAQFFLGMSRSPEEMTRDLFANEHALGQQRFFDVMCLIYGSDPKTFGPILTPAMVMVEDAYEKAPDTFDAAKYTSWLTRTNDLNILPWERAIRCPQEYARYSASWDYLTDTFMVAQED